MAIDASTVLLFLGVAFFGTHALVIFSDTALMVAVLCNVALWQFSIWLPALRQPAHRHAAPKCHSPSPYGWPSCGGQCTVQCRGKPPHAASRSHGQRPSLPGVCQLCGELGRQQATSFSEPARLSAVCEYSPVGQMLGYQAELLSIQGSFGVPRSNICQQSKACLFSQAVASRPSLTCRSSRHPQVSLVGSLRASRSGAAYLWR